MDASLQQYEEVNIIASLKAEKGKLKAEVDKIKEEINSLIAQKSDIVKEINIPIYKAKAEAEKIISEANAEAEVIINAAKKLEGEAEQSKAKAIQLLHIAKGDIEKFNADKKKLADDKVDFESQKFAYENTIRNQRNETTNLRVQYEQDLEVLNGRLIDIKQREDSMARREAEVIKREGLAKDIEHINEVRQVNLDEGADKLVAKKALLDSEIAELSEKQKILQATKEEVEIIKIENQKALDEIRNLKAALTIQQNDLDRQIQLYDNVKADADDKMKTVKEKERLIELKMRQNDEKIATLKQLRGEK